MRIERGNPSGSESPARRQEGPEIHNETAVVNGRGESPEKATQVVKPETKTPARIRKDIIYAPSTGKPVDQNIVNFTYYNSFNYSLLSKDRSNLRLTLGVTSPNGGEGKTVVAANLAVSLTLGFQKKAVLVDLNIQRPRLHEVFNVPCNPGLLDALRNGSVNVAWTPLENLAVLPSGSARDRRSNGEPASRQSLVGLEYMSSFGQVVRSLEEEFEFVIVDMPSINSRNFPILFANQLDGLIVVVDTTRTRREDVEKLFRQVNEKQVLGFVFNRVRDDDN